MIPFKLSLMLSHPLVFMANEREKETDLNSVTSNIQYGSEYWCFIEAYEFGLEPNINSLLSVLRSVHTILLWNRIKCLECQNVSIKRNERMKWESEWKYLSKSINNLQARLYWWHVAQVTVALLKTLSCPLKPNIIAV